MECVFIAVGIIGVLAVVTCGMTRRADAASSSRAQSLVAIKDWTFLLGPGFVVGIGNGLILGYLMYRSGLVPRGMAMLGLDRRPADHPRRGSACCSTSSTQAAPVQAIATMPEFLWELSLGIYLTVKGFKGVCHPLGGPAGPSCILP